ncbi:hypothetical protein DT019_08340 [Streptomyces sp. SDr-06]|nr:hypothetical protein DT019_08340 [Streptomyces sp. SDr-06]
MDGVVNLALTFGTLLSSQGTDASFVLTLTGFPPGASLRHFVFRLYQTLSRPIPRRIGVRFPVPAFAFPFRRLHYFSGFPRLFIIESFEFEFRHAEMQTRWGSIVGSGWPPGVAEQQGPSQAARATLGVA